MRIFNLFLVGFISCPFWGVGASHEAKSPLVGAADAVVVHYTRICPRGKVIIPGIVRGASLSNSPKDTAEFLEMSKNFPNFRPTVHGVLNGRVARHEIMLDGSIFTVDRSGYPYAVLWPWDKVQQYVCGGNQQDVIMLGRIPLEHACVLAMHGHEIPEDLSALEIVELKEKNSIFQGVEDWLKDHGKPVIHALDEDQQTIRYTEKNVDTFFTSSSLTDVQDCMGKKERWMEEVGLEVLTPGMSKNPRVNFIKTGLRKDILGATIPFPRPIKHILVSLNGKANQPLCTVLECDQFPQLNWARPEHTCFGEFEKKFRIQSPFFEFTSGVNFFENQFRKQKSIAREHIHSWILTNITEEAVQPLRRPLMIVSTKALKQEYTDIVDHLNALTKQSQSWNPTLQKAFGLWKAEWKLWLGLMKEEHELRRKGKSFADSVESIVELMKKIDQVLVGIEAIYADKPAPHGDKLD